MRTIKLSFDGSAEGQHTLDDLLAFYQACCQLGMPGTATIEGSTKILGRGPLKTITAQWTEAIPLPVSSVDIHQSLVPGIPDQAPRTTPLPTIIPGPLP